MHHTDPLAQRRLIFDLGQPSRFGKAVFADIIVLQLADVAEAARAGHVVYQADDGDPVRGPEPLRLSNQRFRKTPARSRRPSE